MTTVTPLEVRQARAYLQKQNISSADIPPNLFAMSAKEMGKSFRETLNFLARLLSGGQGDNPSPGNTKNVDILKPENAIGGDPIEYANAEGAAHE